MLSPFRPDRDQGPAGKVSLLAAPTTARKGLPTQIHFIHRTADSSKAGSPSPHGSLLKGWPVTAEKGGARDHGA